MARIDDREEFSDSRTIVNFSSPRILDSYGVRDINANYYDYDYE